MTNIEPITLLNKQFRKFGKSMVKSNDKNIGYFVNKSQDFQQQYKAMDKIDIFCSEAKEMAEEFKKTKNFDFAGILYSWIIKMKNIPQEIREYAIKEGLYVAEQQNDYIHMLARLAELKEIYKGKSKKKLLKTLIKQEQVLTIIVKHYDDILQKFKTVTKQPNSIEQYKNKLAETKVNIAKLLMGRDPGFALRHLYQAKEIFIELNRNENEIKFIKKLISQASGKMQSKP